ncbi:MAG: YraN family protein [Granulosicoccaceae bacterium]|jgi:putative endonuclease
MDARHRHGRAAEQAACDYLQAQGLQLVARNVRLRGGELDLVMREGDSLVFVEVRYRRRNRYGSAAESVDRRKQQRLITAAHRYLQQHDPAQQYAARFDVVTMRDAEGETLEWHRNAFEA